ALGEEGNGKFLDVAAASRRRTGWDAANFVGVATGFDEPEGAVRASHDSQQPGVGGGDRELLDVAAAAWCRVRGDAPNLVATGFGEPEGSVGAGSNCCWVAVGGG